MSNKPLTGCQEEDRDASVVLFRKESFEKFLSGLIETYGQAGYSMVFALAKSVGQSEFKSVMEEQQELTIPMTRPKLLKKVLDRYSAMGWGKFVIESLELNSSAIVVVTNNIFKGSCSPESVGCCFIQGLIAGFMSEVFDSEPVYGQPRCFIQETNRCLFNIRTKKFMEQEPNPINN